MSALVSFREIDVSDAHQILKWRRNSRVADFLTNDVVDDLSAQRDWVRASFGRPDYYHWLFSLQGVDAGVLSIADFDHVRGVTSWGYYVGEDSCLGLGAIIPPYLYNWLFRSLGLKKVQVEVFSTNEVVLRMHNRHGYFRVPEKDRKILKSGREIVLQAMELKASDWLKQHAMEKFVADFPTNHWSARPSRVAASYQNE